MTARTKQDLYDKFSSGGSAKHNISQIEQNYEDLIDSIRAVGTITVAASDASDASKVKSDYQCDGTADNVEIQAAIAAVLAAGGGRVILSEGTFSLDAYIIARTEVSIVGMGFGTILQVSSGTSAHGIYSYNVTDYYIANLAIDVSLSGSAQAGGGSTPCGIYLAMSTQSEANIQIRNIYVTGADEVGIITLGADNVQIVDNIIEDCTFAGIHTDNQNYVVISRNIVKDCTSYGIRITANTDYSIVADNIITGCGILNTISLSVLDNISPLPLVWHNNLCLN